MKSIKKTIYLETITLVIVGLLIISTASVIAQKPQINENKVITQINKTNIKPTDLAYSRTLENKKICKQPSNTLDQNLFPGVTPAISNSGSSMAFGFNSLDLSNVYFSGSTDAGVTWTDGVGWQIAEPPELPAVDGCGDGRFIATMCPNYNDNDGGAGYLIKISNPSDTATGYTCNYYTWNTVGAGYTNFIDVACGGYTAVDPTERTWAYGGSSIVGDHGVAGSQTLFFSYQSTEAGSAWIYRFTSTPGVYNGATSTSMDIDQNTLYSYAVYNYNNKGNMDIFLFIMDFGHWNTTSNQHDQNWELLLNTTGNDNKLDVSAFKNNVIIVSERDGSIVSYYGNDPLNNGFNETIIIAGAQEPRISHLDQNKAICEFIKDGVSYYSTTNDGGATWSTPTIATEGTAIQNADICPLGYAYESANTIYFAPLPTPDVPTITGPASGTVGKSTDYVFTTTDPISNQVFYYVDWGDGQNSGWQGPYASGAAQTISHTWATKGDYTIKAKAKNTVGLESAFATLPVTMPITITPPFHQFLEKLFERFPNAFPVLRQLLGY